ncbi:hypothetical protein ACIOWF_06845 [Cellulosimicrobium cellulans]|uniref:hypothetical protein n=1 Tax=Cellulosimicrobium cellulans TaxID=1710 RepID=UPI0037FAD9C4
MTHHPDPWVESDRLKAIETNVAAVAKHFGVLVSPPWGSEDEAPSTTSETGTTVATRPRAVELMTMWWDETLWLPFVESEDCDITGPGHQDKDTFAALVNAYDTRANGAVLERVDAAMVVHDWIRVLVNDAEEWVRSERVPQDHPDAVAVTTIWGVR